MNEKNELVLFKSKDGSIEIPVRMEAESLWLTRMQMAELFGVTPQNITLHMRNVYKSGELEATATSKESLLVQNEGGREITRKVLSHMMRSYLLDTAEGDPGRQVCLPVPEGGDPSAEVQVRLRLQVQRRAHGAAAACAAQGGGRTPRLRLHATIHEERRGEDPPPLRRSAAGRTNHELREGREPVRRAVASPFDGSESP